MTTKRVWEEMSENLITIGWNETMANAYRRMQIKQVRHLPVMNETGEIVGILSNRDVQRSMVSMVDRSPGQMIADETIEFNPNSRVRDYMSWPVQTVDQNTDLRVVAERMVTEKISSLLVSHSGRACGIVTADDLLRVLVDLLSDPKVPQRWTLGSLLDQASTKLEGTLI